MTHSFAIELYRTKDDGFGRWETFGYYQTDDIIAVDRHVTELNNNSAWKIGKRCLAVRLRLRDHPGDEEYETELPSV